MGFRYRYRFSCPILRGRRPKIKRKDYIIFLNLTVFTYMIYIYTLCIFVLYF